ncbi:DUF6894 family protein [Aureimonas phyllosphaerae]|uniref:DUF6894 domain-containing protein n=1 Tax=Aureimonas phyllosphaerae TaxID=1166078 RepID=A0A7W6BLJ7_9HYPH|nr:hypothetical protein [Aureimonas phyllosphaerae]MBB3934101.1 hypothetical protein [Aureimonas phyllosphaerae]MBB3958683.1 hypothetical protein [Aureimonas phyllosphaerae]SFF17925.1 hypothetical protein SAMN05216566_10428 [Aureimonas phyllosphaerae]
MRRFFYDIRRGSEVIPDPDGELQPSLQGAMAEAISAARDLVIDAILTLRQIDDDAVLIRDSDGAIVGSVCLVDVLPIRR